MFTIREVSDTELSKEPSGLRKAFLESIYWKIQLKPNTWFAIVENVTDYESIRSNLDSTFAKKYKIRIKSRQTNKESKLGTVYVMFTG
jgi:DNA-binding transcriptional regulator WhiA